MATLIGGMRIKELCELCDISRQSLHRYRKDPHWPGDEAGIDWIKQFIVSKRPANRSGRKKKVTPAAAPAAPAAAPDKVLQRPERQPGLNELDDELDDEYANLQGMLDLDDELKRTVIEKNKAQVAKYQAACTTEIVERLDRKMSKAVSYFVNELLELDLTKAQLNNMKRALQKMQAMMLDRETDDDLDQPELELGESSSASDADELENNEVSDE